MCNIYAIVLVSISINKARIRKKHFALWSTMSKYDGKYDDDGQDEPEDDVKLSEGKYSETYNAPRIEIIAISVNPIEGELTDPIELRIGFELDRDVVAAFWRIKVSI